MERIVSLVKSRFDTPRKQIHGAFTLSGSILGTAGNIVADNGHVLPNEPLIRFIQEYPRGFSDVVWSVSKNLPIAVQLKDVRYMLLGFTDQEILGAALALTGLLVISIGHLAFRERKKRIRS